MSDCEDRAVYGFMEEVGLGLGCGRLCRVRGGLFCLVGLLGKGGRVGFRIWAGIPLF